jgi:hypothetical protein
MFELFGQFVRDGIADMKTMMGALKYVVVFDWKTMEPMLRHLNQVYGLEANPWRSYEWLAKETEKHLKAKEPGGPDVEPTGVGEPR